MEYVGVPLTAEAWFDVLWLVVLVDQYSRVAPLARRLWPLASCRL